MQKLQKEGASGQGLKIAPRKESLRIDLWTKDMPLDEMKLFFYQKIFCRSRTLGNSVF